MVAASASVTAHLNYVCVYIEGSYPWAPSGVGGGAGGRGDPVRSGCGSPAEA